jgi:hypothetical protein
VDAVNKQAKSLSDKVETVNKQLSNVEVTATHLAVESTAVNVLTIGFAFDVSAIGTWFGERPIRIRIGTYDVCDIELIGNSIKVKQEPDSDGKVTWHSDDPAYRGNVGGALTFMDKREIPLRTVSGFNYIEASRLSGGRFGNLARAVTRPPIDCTEFVVLRITTDAMPNYIRESEVPGERLRPTVQLDARWPFILLRDLRSASFEWAPKTKCKAIIVGVNESAWAGVNCATATNKERGEWRDIGGDLIEHGVKWRVWQK